MQERIKACKAYVLENYAELEAKVIKDKACKNDCDQQGGIDIPFNEEILKVTYWLYDHDGSLDNFQLQIFNEAEKTFDYYDIFSS